MKPATAMFATDLSIIFAVPKIIPRDSGMRVIQVWHCENAELQ